MAGSVRAVTSCRGTRHRLPTCGAKRAGAAEPAASAEQQQIPIAKITFGPDDEDAVLSVLRSGRLTSGPWVDELESAFAKEHKVSHAVAVSSGTTGLVAALRAHRIGPGDEVITSPFTFVATLNSILEVGATAVFADVAEDLTIDPSALSSLISPRTSGADAGTPVRSSGGYARDRRPRACARPRHHRGRGPGPWRSGRRPARRLVRHGRLLAVCHEERHMRGRRRRNKPR